MAIVDVPTLLFGFLLGLLVPLLVRFLLPSRTNELYTSAEPLLLNLSVPSSRWMNMGYWTSSLPSDPSPIENFEQAATQLARKVAEGAGLKGGERICDVGFGCGDSIRLWKREYRPRSVVGFTSLPAQVDIAVKACRGLENVRLGVGDGAKVLTGLPPCSIDAVLSVDSAYHFSPRSAFLQSSFAILSPGGTLSLSDLCLSPAPLQFTSSLLLRLICLLSSVPFTNLLTPSAYTASLLSHGFVDPVVTDISAHVFPGFVEFMERRDTEMGGLFGTDWARLMGFMKVVRWFGKGNLRFVLVTARKPSSPPPQKAY